MSTPEAGWYHAEGDPVGTQRYWDGSRWVGDPTAPAGGQASGHAHGRQLASPGTRIGAWLIDMILLGIVAAIALSPAISDVVSAIDGLGPSPTGDEVETAITDAIGGRGWLLAVVGLLGLVWDFAWVALTGGTPGKLMTGIRVARADTGKTPPGVGKAALRTLHRLVGLIPGVGAFISLLVGGVSLVLLFSDDQNRTVMDRVASTVVVKK